MHPTTLMTRPRIYARDRRRQTRTAVGDDQSQVLALQPSSVQILQQALPVRLTFSLAAQEGQQMPSAVAPHPIAHQHLYSLASRGTPHPQAHSIQKQVSILVTQPRLVKLTNRLVQIAGQLRYGLRAHHLAGQRGHHPPHLPRTDAPQKRFPDQQRHLFGTPLKPFQSTGQKTFLPGSRNAQPDRAQAGHKIPLVVAVAIDSPSPRPPFVPPPAGIAIALPLRLQLEKLLPRLLRLPVQIPPETLFHLCQKMLVMLRDRDYLRHVV